MKLYSLEHLLNVIQSEPDHLNLFKDGMVR